MKKLSKIFVLLILLVSIFVVGCSNSKSNETESSDVSSTEGNMEKDVSMEDFKNSCLDTCDDNCTIREIYSCPYIGDGEVDAKFAKLAVNKFEVKYNDLAFMYRCDGKTSHLIQYTNNSNEEGNRIVTDDESLCELQWQAHDWYNSYKNEQQKEYESYDSDDYKDDSTSSSNNDYKDDSTSSSNNDYDKYLGKWYAGYSNYVSDDEFSFCIYDLDIKSLSENGASFTLIKGSGRNPASFRESSAEDIEVTSIENGRIYFTFVDSYTAYYSGHRSQGCLVLDGDRIYLTAEDAGYLTTDNEVFTREEI